MELAIALPIIVNDVVVGTSFIAGFQGSQAIFVTTLHHLGNGREFKVAVPPHAGDMAQFQPYPLSQVRTLNLTLLLAEPILDLAILVSSPLAAPMPPPKFVLDPREIKIGEEVVIAGYPFAAIGSLLETTHIGHVSALGLRNMGPIGREELILSVHTHPGNSGSPVIRRSDGAVCGVIRGCLAPPSMFAIGNIPLGSDSSVTYATTAHYIPKLLQEAMEVIGAS